MTSPDAGTRPLRRAWAGALPALLLGLAGCPPDQNIGPTDDHHTGDDDTGDDDDDSAALDDDDCACRNASGRRAPVEPVILLTMLIGVLALRNRRWR